MIFRVKKKPNETRELNSTISKKRSLKLGMHRDKTLHYIKGDLQVMSLEQILKLFWRLMRVGSVFPGSEFDPFL